MSWAGSPARYAARLTLDWATEYREMLATDLSTVVLADRPLAASNPPVPVETEEQPRSDRLLHLLHGQADILRIISKTGKLQRSLEQIGQLAEELFDSAICVIQIVDPDSCLLHNATARTLAADFAHAIHGARSDDISSPAGLAIQARGDIALADLASDAAAVSIRNAALAAGLRACWVFPTFDQHGAALGAFMLFFPTPRAPDKYDTSIATALTSLVRFAIKHDRRAIALRSANERFASLAASIPGVVYQRTVSPSGDIRYSYISDGAQELFGVSPEEILSDPDALFDRHGPEYRENFRKRLIEASREMRLWDVEATIIARDGRRKFTHALARPHRLPDGTVVWDGVILDATRIKEAELRAASAAEGTRQAIIENLSQGFVLLDAEDRMVVCTGFYRDLYPELHDVIAVGVGYADLARAEIEHGIDPIDAGSDPAACLQLRLANHAGPQLVWERRLPDGRWLLITERRTGNGTIVCLHTDVTQLKQREIELERSNRELQEFASVASHDLQEPLRKIEAFGDRLKQRLASKLGDDERGYLDRIESATRRMRALIEDLLVYARVTTQAKPLVACDLNQVAADVISDLEINLKESGGRVDCAALETIDADPTQMRQLLQNLISNALKFSRPGEVPVVRILSRMIKDKSVSASGKGREFCELDVCDNGIGFDMRYLDRIFTIFQRLHGRTEYEGTGIGLATCRKIAERHGGTITAVSAPGRGATFRVTLPARRVRSEGEA